MGANHCYILTYCLVVAVKIRPMTKKPRRPIRPIEELDPQIDAAIKKLLEKKAPDFPGNTPEYSSLIDSLITSSRTGNDVEYEDRLVRGLNTLKQCIKFGASKYLSAQPTAMCELMTLSSGGDLGKDKFPSLDKGQHILLREFRKEWDKSVKPLIAMRIEKYGREKLTAQGLVQNIREWFETEHHALTGLMKQSFPEKFEGVMIHLRGLNASPVCEKSFKFILNRTKRQKASEEEIENHLNIITNHFMVEESAIQPQAMLDLKWAIKDMMFEYPLGLGRDVVKSIENLRHRFWDLVEHPYYDTSNTLKLPYRGDR